MANVDVTRRGDKFPLKTPMAEHLGPYSISGANAAQVWVPPSKYWRLRGVLVHLISGAGLDTGETFDLISYDLAAGGDQAAWTFTAEAFTQAAAAPTEKFYMCHRDLDKCWTVVPGSAARTYNSGLQITMANEKPLSTVTDSSLPAVNSPVGLQFATNNFVAGDSLTYELTVFYDNLDESW